MIGCQVINNTLVQIVALNISMNIIYIHGANATSESFTHIREHIGGSDVLIEYDSADGFNNNLLSMIEQLQDVDDMFFIAHSLGGIYALHLANHYKDRVKGGVTLSTPYGGSKTADYAKYFLPFSRLMRDIGPNSEPMSRVRSLILPAHWTNIVTTKGNSPWMNEANDGVVTLDSMRKCSGMELIELNLNHYEVVISNKTLDIIKQKIKLVN